MFNKGLLLILVFLGLQQSLFSKETFQKKEETEKKTKHKSPEKKVVKKKKEKKPKKKESGEAVKPAPIPAKNTTVKEKTTNPEPAQEAKNDGYTHLPLLTVKPKKSADSKANPPEVTPSITPLPKAATSNIDANGRTIFEGPYGSRYFINKNGKKFYLKPATKN
jgi:hypothetical protein